MTNTLEKIIASKKTNIEEYKKTFGDNLSNNENVSSEENIVKVNNEKITFQEKK